MRYRAKAGHIVGRWSFHKNIERRAACKMESPLIRVVDRLAIQAVRAGHERSDHVDELSETGNFDSPAMTQQGVDQSPNEQRILQVINFFQQMRLFLRVPIHRVATACPIPDIPLIERQPELLA